MTHVVDTSEKTSEDLSDRLCDFLTTPSFGYGAIRGKTSGLHGDLIFDQWSRLSTFRSIIYYFTNEINNPYLKKRKRQSKHGNLESITIAAVGVACF
jgi:hypothetical protein